MSRLTPGRDPVLAESPQLTAFVGALATALGRRPCVVPAGPRRLRVARPDDLPTPQRASHGPAPARDTPVIARHLEPAAPIDERSGPPAGEDPVAAAWREFAQGRTADARDRLVLHYISLVWALAHRMATGLPPHVDLADLAQAGVFGLIDAIQRYEPERATRFESYAAQRIRGAMLDELRAQDWVPRSVRNRVREVERARERLENRLHRSVSGAELAAELGITLRELRSLGRGRAPASIEAMDESGRTPVAETVVDDTAPDPMHVLELRETAQHLAVAVGQLGVRDRLVVRLYYVENRTLAEIGRILGVTESRVCQLHSRLVLRLRGRMEELAAG